MSKDDVLNDMIEYFGQENIPNPKHHPKRFDFLVRSYEHYLKMKKTENVPENTKSG